MNVKPLTNDVVRLLQKIGVDTRFVSIVGTSIFVNNQRFSKFSKKRQEIFSRNFPCFTVYKSNVFQKICTRASRDLANSIKPGETIFIYKDGTCKSILLNIILEPYTRKYGIDIIYDCDHDSKALDSLALPVTLDNEAVNIVRNIINGRKIEINRDYDGINDIKQIYPLLHVPKSWIVAWFDKIKCECEYLGEKSYSEELIKFFEDFIPDVRENFLKSAAYVSKECVYKD